MMKWHEIETAFFLFLLKIAF